VVSNILCKRSDGNFLGKDRLNRFRKAFESVHTGDENILHAAVLQFALHVACKRDVGKEVDAENVLEGPVHDELVVCADWDALDLLLCRWIPRAIELLVQLCVGFTKERIVDIRHAHFTQALVLGLKSLNVHTLPLGEPVCDDRIAVEIIVLRPLSVAALTETEIGFYVLMPV